MTEPEKRPSVIVALPHAEDPVHDIGPEESHVTLLYLGDTDQVDPDAISAEVAKVARGCAGSFSDNVNGEGTLGPDKAQVLLLDGSHLGGVRGELLNQPGIKEAHDAATQHPNWIPHLTLGYPGQAQTTGSATAAPEQGRQPTKPSEVSFDRLAVWHGDMKIEHPMGRKDGPVDDETADDTTTAEASDETVTAAGGFAAPSPVPWHGVLTTEGHASGDRRSFKPGSLRTRNLPLPLTWQKVSDEGHKGSVKIARIDALTRVPIDGGKNEIRAHGLMMPADDNADKVIGEMAFFGRIGVSVDIDDATFEVTAAEDNGRPHTEFTDARVASACAVIIPAFQEAWLQLGEAPEGFMDGGTSTETAEPETEAGVVPDELAAQFDAQFARGPGWITNPEDTKRLHDYWTVPGQPGYAKVAWGTAGDYNRCISEIGQERAEQDPAGTAKYIHAQCAQWHKDALGYWPATHAKMVGGSHGVENGEAAAEAQPEIALVAAAGVSKWPTPKMARFANPHLTEVTPIQFTEEDGVTYVHGHFSNKNECHLDFPGMCVGPPPLLDNGMRFMCGATETDQGRIATGCLTLGGGHADTKLGWLAAKEHYDDVTSAVADVCVGEDEFGHWFAGVLRPFVTDAQRYQLFAGKLSGDWRMVGGEMTLIAAHAVNTPGFLVAQTRVKNGEQIALVAAGGVQRTEVEAGMYQFADTLNEPPTVEVASTVTVNGQPLEAVETFRVGPPPDLSQVVEEGIRRYKESEQASARLDAVAEAAGMTPAHRIDRLRQAAEGI